MRGVRPYTDRALPSRESFLVRVSAEARRALLDVARFGPVWRSPESVRVGGRKAPLGLVASVLILAEHARLVRAGKIRRNARRAR